MYYTLNIVTSVGYGDLFATTDIERLLSMVIILLGDALIAVGFGMMASLSINKFDKDSIKAFLSQMTRYQKTLKSQGINDNLINKVEMFYAYK